MFIKVSVDELDSIRSQATLNANLCCGPQAPFSIFCGSGFFMSVVYSWVTMDSSYNSIGIKHSSALYACKCWETANMTIFRVGAGLLSRFIRGIAGATTWRTGILSILTKSTGSQVHAPAHLRTVPVHIDVRP